MGLKPDKIEVQKKSAENKLAARQAILKAKGLDDRAVERDPLIRKARADIRRAAGRLARVAALEKQNAELAQAKANKAAGAEPKEGKKKQDGGDKKPKKEKVKEKDG